MAVEGVGGGAGPSISEGDQGDSGSAVEISTESTDTELESGYVDTPDLDTAANDHDVEVDEEAEPRVEPAGQEGRGLPEPPTNELLG